MTSDNYYDKNSRLKNSERLKVHLDQHTVLDFFNSSTNIISNAEVLENVLHIQFSKKVSIRNVILLKIYKNLKSVETYLTEDKVRSRYIFKHNLPLNLYQKLYETSLKNSSKKNTLLIEFIIKPNDISQVGSVREYKRLSTEQKLKYLYNATATESIAVDLARCDLETGCNYGISLECFDFELQLQYISEINKFIVCHSCTGDRANFSMRDFINATPSELGFSESSSHFSEVDSGNVTATYASSAINSTSVSSFNTDTMDEFEVTVEKERRIRISNPVENAIDHSTYSPATKDVNIDINVDNTIVNVDNTVVNGDNIDINGDYVETVANSPPSKICPRMAPEKNKVTFNDHIEVYELSNDVSTTQNEIQQNDPRSETPETEERHPLKTEPVTNEKNFTSVVSNNEISENISEESEAVRKTKALIADLKARKEKFARENPHMNVKTYVADPTQQPKINNKTISPLMDEDSDENSYVPLPPGKVLKTRAPRIWTPADGSNKYVAYAKRQMETFLSYAIPIVYVFYILLLLFSSTVRNKSEEGILYVWDGAVAKFSRITGKSVGIKTNEKNTKVPEMDESLKKMKKAQAIFKEQNVPEKVVSEKVVPENVVTPVEQNVNTPTDSKVLSEEITPHKKAIVTEEIKLEEIIPIESKVKTNKIVKEKIVPEIINKNAPEKSSAVPEKASKKIPKSINRIINGVPEKTFSQSSQSTHSSFSWSSCLFYSSILCTVVPVLIYNCMKDIRKIRQKEERGYYDITIKK